MVIMKSLNERHSNETKLKSDLKNKFKDKISKENSPSVKNILSSPSKIPLTSSSLANINNGSPSKPILRTPQKHQKQTLLLTPSSSPNFKSTKIKLESLLEHQTPLLSPSSSDGDTSIKLEEEYPDTPGTPVYPTLLEPGSILGEGNSSASSCQKRITSSFDNSRPDPPVSRRNARERNRVKQVSMGFALLRQHVPNGNRKKKLSKVETLRCAVEYIRSLQSLLQENPSIHTPTSTIHTPTSTIHTSSTTIQQKSQLKYHQNMHSDQYQLPMNGLIIPKQEDNFHYTLKKVASLQHHYQRTSSPETYYEDKAIYQQMSGGSCLDAHVLKVPKVEDPFPATSDYLPSILSFSTNNYPKVGSVPLPNTSQSGCIEEIPVQQDHKDPLGHLPTDLPEYFTQYTQKETGDTDLMDALAWWQQNS